MPDPVSAIVAGGVGSAALGLYGSSMAADAQKDAADKAADVQWRMYQQSRQDLAPWREAGARALGTLEQRMGAGPGEFQASPSYQFAKDEALRAQQRAASATGRLGSGAYLRDATRYAENLASTEYQNFLNRYYQSLTPWQKLAGVGQETATQTGLNALTTGQGVGAANLYSGQAQAANYINAANIGTNALSGASNAYLNYNALQNLAQQSGYGPNYYGPGGGWAPTTFPPVSYGQSNSLYRWGGA